MQELSLTGAAILHFMLSTPSTARVLCIYRWVPTYIPCVSHEQSKQYFVLSYCLFNGSRKMDYSIEFYVYWCSKFSTFYQIREKHLQLYVFIKVCLIIYFALRILVDWYYYYYTIVGLYNIYKKDIVKCTTYYRMLSATLNLKQV